MRTYFILFPIILFSVNETIAQPISNKQKVGRQNIPQKPISKKKKLPEPAKKNISLDEIKAQSVQLYKNNRYKKIVNLLHPILDQLTKDSLDILGTSFYKLSQFEDAITVYTLSVEKTPDLYVHHYKLALAYEKAHLQKLKSNFKYKNQEEREYANSAISHYRKAIRINSKFFPAYKNLLELFKLRSEDQIKNKHFENTERIHLLDVMINKFGRKISFLEQLCETYYEEGFFSKSLAVCKEVLKKNPKSETALITSTQALKKIGSKKEFYSSLHRANTILRKSAKAQLIFGKLYLEETNFDSAKICFQNAIKSDDKNTEAHIEIAKLLFKDKKYQKAFTHYVKACELSGSYRENLTIASGQLLQMNQLKMHRMYRNYAKKCYTKTKNRSDLSSFKFEDVKELNKN